ncbi:Indole-3-glycerol-phosphate synthase [Thermocrinis albus DSM 14484]|uniref:Indole-3-glycerol phosphate synthase n=1 Tax=Thermocrinis albus (strain DSM 14484 / JCM 11386 / HI 11/12) TaxID=638303 RepID=D3SLR1_THEAH|nr:indole-3-glycerol phosphate synthase TrpC [Thermocrinis albus]ADC89691.1 Indole-3-glycerol-phosphate synthase [Thermocrinis albus DSM 14484]
MSFLEKILKVKRREISKSKDYRKNLAQLISLRGPTRPWEQIFTKDGTRIIAEVKRASPSAGSLKDVKASHQAVLYERAGAVAISVLTDKEFFKGSLEDLREVSAAVKVPVLRKDFLLDPVQVEEARAFGADAVLLIVRILDDALLKDLLELSRELTLGHLVEVFNLREAERALKAGAYVIGINNRDLDTFRVDISVTKQLAPVLKEMGARYVVAESGIESKDQIEELKKCGVDAFLIGTSLMKSDDPVKKLMELL